MRAYQLFEQRGRQDGHDVEDWLQAEAEITSKKQPQNVTKILHRDSKSDLPVNRSQIWVLHHCNVRCRGMQFAGSSGGNRNV